MRPRLVRLVRLADVIDIGNDWLGRKLAWLVAVVVLGTFAVAGLRYGAAFGRVWLQDLCLWANAIAVMMGSAYTLRHDRHVRVDFIYSARGPRYRAIVNLGGVLFLMVPTLGAILVTGWPYVARSWSRLEGSLDAGGLPGVFLLKSIIVLSMLPLAAQTLSLAARALAELVDHEAAAALRTVHPDDATARTEPAPIDA